jgi:hypothetical protein
MSPTNLYLSFTNALSRLGRSARVGSSLQNRRDVLEASVPAPANRASAADSSSSTSAESSSPHRRLEFDLEAQQPSDDLAISTIAEAINIQSIPPASSPPEAEALRRSKPKVKPRPDCRLMNLPPEIQLHIIRHLEFGELENLRRTCRFYLTFVNKNTVKELLGPNIKQTLLAHCYLCLTHDPTRATLLWAEWNNPRYPLASKCVDCAFRDGDLKVGRKVALANYASVWVCRMCGYPISADAAANQPEFHKQCYRGYNHILLVFFILGWVQWSLGVVASALCWTYFKHDSRILAPSIVS